MQQNQFIPRDNVGDEGLKREVEFLRREFENSRAVQRTLEMQIGQLARMNNERPSGTLPSDTIPNPKEQCNAITLRSGKEVVAPEKEKEEEERTELKVEVTKQKVVDNESTRAVKEEIKETKKTTVEEPMHETSIKVPFPQRLVDPRVEGKKKQFNQFLDMLRKININIPLIEALTKMPNYARFMKDLLAKKRRWEDDETVSLDAKCSAIFQRNLPPKLKDPGSFMIPVQIGGATLQRSLCEPRPELDQLKGIRVIRNEKEEERNRDRERKKKRERAVTREKRGIEFY